jgi:hypothetical protein
LDGMIPREITPFGWFRMRVGKKKRGVTSLIELVVSFALLIYLLIMVAWALVYCNQYLRNIETKTEAQARSLQAMIWLSRSLSEANITVCSSTHSAGIYCVDFPSPRDPGDTSVAWDKTSANLLWKQQMYCYLTPPVPDQVPSLEMKAYPLIVSGGGTSAEVPGTGPPYPTAPTDCVDLPTVASIPDFATGMAGATTIHRTVSPNIRQLLVDIYNPADLALATFFSDPLNEKFKGTCNITLEGFAPYYGLNYGVIVSTQVRIQN